MFLLLSLAPIQAETVSQSGLDVLKQHFPCCAKEGLYYVYKTDHNVSGSLKIYTKDEYVNITEVHNLTGLVILKIVVKTKQYLNGTLIQSLEAPITINLPVEEIPTTPRVLWFFFNCKNLTSALTEYLRGLSVFVPVNTTIEMHNGIIEILGMNRSVVVGVIEGWNGNQFTHAEYYVDNETGLLLKKIFVRYVYGNVTVGGGNSTKGCVSVGQLEAVEREITELTETNFFAEFPEEEVKYEAEVKILRLPPWLIVLLAVVFIALAVALVRQERKSA